MGALVEQFTEAGIRLEAWPDGKLAAHGQLTDEQRAVIRANKSAILAELQQAPRAAVQREASEPRADVAASPLAGVGIEARRQRVVEILAANPGFRYAVVTDSKADPGVVVVHIGIRDVGSGEIVIAAGRYDGLELLKSLEAQAAQAAAAPVTPL